MPSPRRSALYLGRRCCGRASPRGDLHVAVLVLLAAAAGARVVAADALAAVADRLGLLLGLLAALDGGHLLGLDAALRRRRGHGRAGLLVPRLGDGPHRLLEALGLLHAEDGVAHLVAQATPHPLELLHAVAL